MKFAVTDCEVNPRSIRSLDQDRLNVHRVESRRLYDAISEQRLVDLIHEKRRALAESHGAMASDRRDSACDDEMSPHCGSYRWHCVQTHPRSELIVLERLAQQQFVAHLPLIYAERPRRARGGASQRMSARLVPMFPRYLFVGFDRSVDQWRRIWSTYGVSMLVGSGPTTPTALSPGIVEMLVERCGSTGIVNAERATSLSRLAPATPVRVLDGPFANVEAIVSMSEGDRVQVLLNLFGRETMAELRRDQLARLG